MLFCGNVFAIILIMFTTWETHKKGLMHQSYSPVPMHKEFKKINKKITGCHNTTEMLKK